MLTHYNKVLGDDCGQVVTLIRTFVIKGPNHMHRRDALGRVYLIT